jgi:hypothetical protein
MSDEKPGAATAPISVIRVVAASFIGTTIEWYDFFLYGTAAALVFNQLFFPTIDLFFPVSISASSLKGFSCLVLRPARWMISSPTFMMCWGTGKDPSRISSLHLCILSQAARCPAIVRRRDCVARQLEKDRA